MKLVVIELELKGLNTKEIKVAHILLLNKNI